MGRKILAVVVALIVAFAVIMIVEMANTLVVSPPASDVMNDPAKLREFMRTLPMTAYVVVLIGYILGAFAGGFIVTKMSRQVSSGITLPIVIGAILEIGAILNFFVMLPGQPIWFVAASLLLIVPAALIGHRFAR
jgi:hypothetical protein